MFDFDLILKEIYCLFHWCLSILRENTVHTGISNIWVEMCLLMNTALHHVRVIGTKIKNKARLCVQPVYPSYHGLYSVLIDNLSLHLLSHYFWGWWIYYRFYMGSVLGGSVFRATTYDLWWPHKPNPKNRGVKPKPKIVGAVLQAV